MSNFTITNECRVCNNTLTEILDLNDQPLANDFHDNTTTLATFPLKLMLCNKCFHSQLNAIVNPDLMFKNYLYVSGTSKTLIDYFKWFVVEFIGKYNNNKTPKVLDIACNDCSLLDIFKDNGWETFGIDPAENLYEISKTKGHNLVCDFWNRETSNNFKNKDLDVIVAQNVFAHLDDVHGFLEGCKNVMNSKTKLFIQTSQKNMFFEHEFDTVYHEHVSFFSIKSMKELLNQHNLFINDVYFPSIHGTSYLFAISLHEEPSQVETKIEEEKRLGRYNTKLYYEYYGMCHKIKNIINNQIQRYKNNKIKVIGYGAAAKGNTFLNFSEITLDYIVDENPNKQNLYTPGTNIIIKTPEYFAKEKNDVAVLVLAWNFSFEITKKIRNIRPNNKDYLFSIKSI